MLEILKLDNYAIVGDGKNNNPINKIYKDEWIRFLEVRQDGQHNMWSPQARDSVGIDRATWAKIISNFDDLYDYWGDLDECI